MSAGNLLSSLKTSVHESWMKVSNTLTGPATKSRFVEEGKLTPEEFVLAGDELVGSFATWSWQAGDFKRAVSWLPTDKQFLITRNISCVERADTLEASANSATSSMAVEMGFDDLKFAGEAGEEDDSWIATNLDENKLKDSGAQSEGPAAAAAAAAASGSEDEGSSEETGSDEDIPDMLEFGESSDAAVASGSNTNVVRCRTYDIMITYDQYYGTPRVWLSGYDEMRQPLKPEQIFQDISQEHAHKTVTIDTHPHLGHSCAYIHPCKHSHVMKRIMERLIDSGTHLTVEQYLFVFLKFLSAVIPTMDFDFTRGFDTGPAKAQ